MGMSNLKLEIGTDSLLSTSEGVAKPDIAENVQIVHVPIHKLTKEEVEEFLNNN